MSNALRPLRSFVAMLRREQHRDAIGQMLQAPVSKDAHPALTGLVKAGVAEQQDDTVTVSESFLEEAQQALERALGPVAILDAERISVGDLKQGEVDATVAAVARRVLAPGERVSEAALNERLRTLVVDFAFFRRHAVDTGVLARTADGAMYWLA